MRTCSISAVPRLVRVRHVINGLWLHKGVGSVQDYSEPTKKEDHKFVVKKKQKKKIGFCLLTKVTKQIKNDKQRLRLKQRMVEKNKVDFLRSIWSVKRFVASTIPQNQWFFFFLRFNCTLIKSDWGVPTALILDFDQTGFVPFKCLNMHFLFSEFFLFDETCAVWSPV